VSPAMVVIRRAKIVFIIGWGQGQVLDLCK
jgi:hypothetical protein